MSALKYIYIDYNIFCNKTDEYVTVTIKYAVHQIPSKGSEGISVSAKCSNQPCKFCTGNCSPIDELYKQNQTVDLD